MAAFAVGNYTIKDAAKWAEYRSKVPSTLAPCDGELVFRGHPTEVLAGSHRHTGVVILRFVDMAALSSWFRSPAYQALIPLRDAGADVDLVAYEADN